MYDIQLIKSRITCVTYAIRIGLPIQSSGDRCVSPFRDGAKNPTSFVVYDDFYYDFASGGGGDVIEFCANYSHRGDRGAAIRELAALTGVHSDNENTAEWRQYTINLNNQTAYYHTQLTDSDRAYLHSRGLSDADISRLMIGRVTDGPLRGRLFLPYFSGHNGYVCYYATRVLPESTFPTSKYMKQKRDEHCQHLPWGLQTLNRESDTLIIAEGYFDAVSFEISGYPVLSAITGRFSRDQIPVVLSVARKFKRVLIVYDNDNVTHAGESFSQAMSDLLTKHRIPFVVGTVPQPYHDISEFFAAGGDLTKIVSTAEDGIVYVASRFTEFSDLERFIFTVARHTKRSHLETIMQQIQRQSNFDSDRLKSLFKSATTAPPENIIADEILKSHQLVYVDSVGFYEYSSGVWQQKSDTVISGYADQSYGEFSTYNRTRATVGLLKIRALRDVVFNKLPVWNFINGTLELDTGVFREHNPNDFCSIQATYPYNPEATYDAWSQFITDITADDPRKTELLQLIPGYVLYNDCRLEKGFVLSGTGSNGKSKYLEILRQLFVERNVSHLSPRALLDKFQVIELQHTILNIAGEIKSDLRDTEERIKSIISGEPIKACYKGEQFVTFLPRTKLIYATNGQLSSGDTSDGLTRRLILVHFQVAFVDHPEPGNPYQRQKNTDILDSLTAELITGGVFNWCYEGYKLLRAVGYFTETTDQEQLILDVKRASNPIQVFWEDEYADSQYREIIYDQVYGDYITWCAASGNNPVSAQKFHMELKQLLSGQYETDMRSVRVDGKPRKQRFYRMCVRP